MVIVLAHKDALRVQRPEDVLERALFLKGKAQPVALLAVIPRDKHDARGVGVVQRVVIARFRVAERARAQNHGIEFHVAGNAIVVVAGGAVLRLQAKPGRVIQHHRVQHKDQRHIQRQQNHNARKHSLGPAAFTHSFAP